MYPVFLDKGHVIFNGRLPFVNLTKRQSELHAFKKVRGYLSELLGIFRAN